MINTAIRFGLIGTGVHILIFMVYYFTGANPMVEMYIIDIFILPVFLYFGIREYRDVRRNGLMEFWQGMTTGLAIYILLAMLTACFAWFFVEFIDHGLVEGYIQDRLDMLTENRGKIIEEMGSQAYERSISQINSTTSKVLALDNFFKRLAIGFLLTSIISLIMKRKEI